MTGMDNEARRKEIQKIMDRHRSDAKNPVQIKWGSELKPIEFFSTGIIELNRLTGSYRDDENKQPVWTGHGGVPRGRITIMWGGKGSGKTTTALQTAAECQQAGGIVGYFNSERSLEPAWCEKQGVDLSKMVLWEGGNLEQNMDSMREFVEKGLVDMLVIDTIHAFATSADTHAKGKDGKGKERGMEAEPPQGRLAAKISRFFRIVVGAVADANLSLVVIGQARAAEYFEQLTGGHALHHYNSLNLHFVRINAKDDAPKRNINGTETIVGFIMRVVVDKTRLNHLETKYIDIPFIWGLGPDVFETNVMAAVRLGLIQQAGTWFTLPLANEATHKVQGKMALLDWIRANGPYYDWILRSVTRDFHEPEELAREAAEDMEEPVKKSRRAKK